MALIICTECGKQYSDKAPACPNCGCPTDLHHEPTSAHTQVVVENQTDVVPRSDVMQHLQYAKKLEETIYTYQTTINRLQNIIRTLGHRKEISKPVEITYNFRFWIVFPSIMAFLLIFTVPLMGLGPEYILYAIFILPILLEPDLLIAFSIATGGSLLITCIWCIIHACQRGAEHSKLEDTYAQKVRDDKARVEKEKQQIEQLKAQQASIRLEITKNQKLLDQLYSLDVIYPTYRHMVAVITILEYFKSGRCTQLTGPHGAYDTYSTEEKQNIIIGKLDVVISMLNEIRKTQHLLYESIQESNAIAEQICVQSERNLKESRKISENTALTAYNTSVIRHNTEISAYIDVFRY